MEAASNRQRVKYVGLQRITWLRDGTPVHKGQSRFGAPSQAIVWTREDQARAVEGYGYFLARIQPDNHVRIEVVDRFLTNPPSEATICNGLVAALFRNPRDTFLRKLLSFIEQQDAFGWSDTWEVRGIEQQPSDRVGMRWLQRLKDAKRRPPEVGEDAGCLDDFAAADAHKEKIRFHKMADDGRAARVALGLPLRPMKRLYVAGCPCLYCSTHEQSTVQSTQLI